MSRTVLITGANSGLGFDSARQIATDGVFDRVIISARSQAKGDDAVARLVEQTGKPAATFGVAVFDNNKPGTVRDGVAALAEAGERIDAVVLNAGGVANPDADNKPIATETGLSEMFAMNVGGHAVLVQGLIDRNVLTEGATVMLAGSEASRGIPAMRIATPELPTGHGDVEAAVQAIARGETGGKGYDPMVDYGLVKLIGTVWMQQLAERHGLRALTVSPGFTGGTAAMDKLPAVQKFMFRWVALPIMKLTGNAHDLEFGAKRYVQALTDTSLTAGKFYASGNKGISGPLAEQTPADQPLLADEAFSAAVARLIDQQVVGLRAAA